MEQENTSAEALRIDAALKASGARLEVKSHGDRLVLLTGEGTVRRSRNLARLYCAATAAAGIGLVWFSLWALIAIVGGVAAFVMAPRYIRPATLLEIDAARGELVVVQTSVGFGTTLSLNAVRSIRGAYETKGWDGFSVMYAVATDGSETPILMLLGTDERLAELSCRVLGTLLHCPATYVGPFGRFSTCFTPEQPG